MAIQTLVLDPNSTSLEEQSISVRNETGSTLAAGDLVFVSGWNAATGEFLADLADAPPHAGHLAQFIMRTALTTATSGTAFKRHTVTGLDTLSSVVGDPIFLSATPGDFTVIEPSFSRQVVGRVAVSSATIGEIEFLLLSDSDSGFVRSNPTSGEFPVSAVHRNSGGNLEVEFDDVAV